MVDCTASKIIPTIVSAVRDALALSVPIQQPSARSHPESSALTLAPAHTDIQLHPRYNKALQNLMQEKHAAFRSVEQMQMIKFIIEERQHGLVIMPTGSGKTLSMVLPSQLESKGITVVVVPFVALLQDLKRRIAHHKISYCEWTGKNSINSLSLAPARIVLAQAENAAKSDFVLWLQALQTAGRLSRIILDEAHTILLDHDWRKSLDLIPHLMQVKDTPIISLTATLAPFSEAAFFQRLHIPTNTRVIRAPSTARPNIEYRVTEVDGVAADVESHVCDIVRSTFLIGSERGIIFCTTIDAVDRLAALLGYPSFKGPMDEREKSTNFECWIKGHKWIVATSALAFGVDYSHVRRVILVECPFEMVSYVQMTGRAGRDGLPSIAEMFYSHAPRLRNIPNISEDHAGKNAMVNYISAPLPCRRTPISRFCDGQSVTCPLIPSAILCDLCIKRSVRLLVFISHSRH